MMTRNRVLILTTAVGYSPEQTLPFRRSLNICGFDGDIVMLLDAKNAKAHRHFPVPQITILPFKGPMSAFRKTKLRFLKKPLYPLLKYPLKFWHKFNPKSAYKIASYFSHVSLSRNFYYYDYLMNHSHDYDWVIVADCRDVLFQEDPSIALPRDYSTLGECVIAGLETEKSRIGAELFNTRWIKNAYGDTVLKELNGKRISCSGALYGTTRAMQTYLKTMCDELTGLTHRLRGGLGSDQGVHNVILHQNKVPHVVFSENFHSPLANLGGEPDALVLSLCPQDELKRQDNNAPIMLVHQYDRFKTLETKLLERLAIT